MGRSRLAAVALGATAVVALVAGSATAVGRAPELTPGTSIDRQEFSDDTTPPGWIIVEQQQSGAQIHDGAVVAHVDRRNYGHRVVTTEPAPAPASYAVEVDARLRKGDPKANAWGVQCHGTIDQGYLFLMSSDGFAGIFRQDAVNGLQRLDDSRDRAARKRARDAVNGKRKAQNRVRGECLEGGELRIFVNSKFVTEVTDPEPLPVGTTWGFEPVTFDSKTLVVEFDDFELVDLT